MKKKKYSTHIIWRLCLLLLLLGACHKNPSDKPGPVNPGDVDEPGVATTIGVAKGTPVSVAIGAQGGTISANNGTIKVEIPPGALTQTTTISIQPITNTTEAGVGDGFRITPHMTFAKPVKITFDYTAQTNEIANPLFTGIAYQHTDNIWYMLPDAQNDTLHKKITVNTTHFSDWSLVKWLSLVPINAIVPTSDDRRITVLRFVPLKPATDDAELILPLVASAIPIGKGHELSASRIKEWKLKGVGVLEGQGSKAVYIAPASVAGTEHAVAICELKVRDAQILLFCHITVFEEGIFLRISNGPELKLPGRMTQKPGTDDYVVESVSAKRPFVTILWPGLAGTWTWADPNEDPSEPPPLKEFSLKMLMPDTTQYESHYFTPDSHRNRIYHTSGGNLVIDGTNGKICFGTFKVLTAGAFKLNTEDFNTITSITGRFAVRIL